MIDIGVGQMYAYIVDWKFAGLCHKNQKEGVPHNRMFKLVW